MTELLYSHFLKKIPIYWPLRHILSFHYRKIRWPIPLPGYIFLLNYIDIIGRQLFPKEWTGLEQLENLLPNLTDKGYQPFDCEVYHFARIILEREDGLSENRRLDVLAIERQLADDAWNRALEIYQLKYAQERHESNARYVETITKVHQCLISGVIATDARNMRGVGTLVEIPTIDWTSDISWASFRFGLRNTDDPLNIRHVLRSPADPAVLSTSFNECPSFLFLKEAPTTSKLTPRRKRLTTKALTAIEQPIIEALYDELFASTGRVKSRPFLAACKERGLSTNLGNQIFAEKNTAKPGQK